MTDPTSTPVHVESDGGAYLSRVGFVLYFVTLIGSSFLACDCGAIPGLIMAGCSLLPLVFGSRLERFAAILCLAFACAYAYFGFRLSDREQRVLRTRALHEQQTRNAK